MGGCGRVWVDMSMRTISVDITTCKSEKNMTFCHLLIIFKISFFKNYFSNNIRMLNSLIPDQARRLSADDKIRRQLLKGICLSKALTCMKFFLYKQKKFLFIKETNTLATLMYEQFIHLT